MDPSFQFWLGLSIGIGIMVMAMFLPRLLKQKPPKDMLMWAGEVERKAIEAIRSDLYAAQTKAELIELIGEIPEEFDPSVMLSCQVAAGAHKAAIREAEAQGLIRAGMFEEIYPTVPVAQPAPSQTPALRLVQTQQSGPNVEWIEGKLVPRKSTRP